MDKWTRDFWLANENECRRTLMEPENWKKVIENSNLETNNRLDIYVGTVWLLSDY